MWVAMGAGAVVLFVGLWLYVNRGPGRSELLDASFPESRPTGEPIAVARAVRAGDAFESGIQAKALVRLSLDESAAGQGMRLDLKLRAREDVVAREGGPGFESRVSYSVDTLETDLPGMHRAVWDAIPPSGGAPATLRFDRAADGTPARGGLRPLPAGPDPRTILERVLAGFSDPSACRVPPRPVRVGEAWELAEVADLAEVGRVVRWAAGLEGDGFPVLSSKGRAWAEGREERGGEACLRVRFRAVLEMSGDVVAPAVPGTVSLGARVEGTAWVALATGIVVEEDLDAALESVHAAKSGTRFERKVTHRVHRVTKRLQSGPPGGR